MSNLFAALFVTWLVVSAAGSVLVGVLGAARVLEAILG